MLPVAVAPILPTAQSLLVIALLLVGSALAGLASCMRPAALATGLRFVWRQKWSLLLLASLLTAGRVGLGWVASALRPANPDQQPLELSGHDAWTTFRGNLARTGWADSQPGPRSGGVAWQVAQGESFYASPAVVGDRIYCVSSRGNAGRIDCRSAETGELLWSTAPRGYEATLSSPVVAGRYLVVGEGLHRTRRGRVVCVDLRPQHAGDILWTFSTNSHVECTPVIDGDRVYVNAGDDGIYCLSLDGPDSQRVVWHAPGSTFPDAETALAVAEGLVYAGLGHGGQALVVLDAATGALRGRLPLEFPAFAPPAVVRDHLLLGIGRGDMRDHSTAAAGQIVCVDRERLTIEWTYATRATVLGAIAYSEGEILVPCTDGHLYVLDEQGALRAEFDSGAALIASPACTRDTVYLLNLAGQLTALDRRRYEPVWTVSLGAPGNYLSSPTLAHGHLFVGTPDTGLLCVGQPLAAGAARAWPAARGGPGAAGCRDASTLPDRAELLWQWPDAVEAKTPLVSAAVAVTEDWLAIPLTRGGRGSVACFSRAAIDQDSLEPWIVDCRWPVRQSPVLRGDVLLVADVAEDQSEGRLVSVHVRERRVQWTHAFEAGASGVLCFAEQMVLVQDAPHRLTALNLSGAVQWRANTGRLGYAPWTDEARVVSASTQPAGLQVRDRLTGKLLWQRPLAAVPTTAVVVHQGQVILGTERGLEFRDLVTGLLEQRWGDTPIGNTLWLDRQGRVVWRAEDELLRSSHRGPQRLLELAPLPAAESFVAAENGLLFQLDDHRLALWREDLGQLQTWWDAEPPDASLGSAVLAGGRLYLGAAGRGLLCLGKAAAAGERTR